MNIPAVTTNTLPRRKQLNTLQGEKFQALIGPKTAHNGIRMGQEQRALNIKNRQHVMS